jgi:hypothetical protein
MFLQYRDVQEAAVLQGDCGFFMRKALLTSTLPSSIELDLPAARRHVIGFANRASPKKEVGHAPPCIMS